MKLFCVVASKDAPKVLVSGVLINKKNILRSEQECMTVLGQVAFESGGAVLFEIHDKLAQEDFDGDLPIEKSSLTIVNPAAVGLEDSIIKQAFDNLVVHNSKVKKSLLKTAQYLARDKTPTFASVLNSLDESKMKMFVEEYNKASTQAKDEQIKNGDKAALMTAMKKIGVKNAS